MVEGRLVEIAQTVCEFGHPRAGALIECLDRLQTMNGVASSKWRIVGGSATGELVGLKGGGEYKAARQGRPFELADEL